MSHIEKVKQARQKFSQTLADSGLSDDEPISESMLIRDGFYVGRRFRRGDVEGIWLVESDELTINYGEAKTAVDAPLDLQHELRKAA